MPSTEPRAGTETDDAHRPLFDLWESRRVVLLGDLAAVLLRHAKLVLGLPLVMGVAAFLYFQFAGSYVAESTLTPEASASGLARLAGLAARFGAAVPGLGGEDQGSIDFYSMVLQSPALLAEVVETPYHFAKTPAGTDSVEGTLVQLYGVKGDDQREKVRKAVIRLQGRLSVSTDRLANVVTLQVKAPWRELAQQINRRMLEVLNTFNLQQRQTQARAERVFAEQRVNLAREELATAEDSLEAFLEKNRSYQTSPRLVFEAARLQRRIDLQQQVYTTLVQAYEAARIDEVRNTPVYTVIQPPELYTRRSRSQIVMGLLAFVFFMVVCATIALLWEYLAQERARHPESFAGLRSALGYGGQPKRPST